MNLITKLKKISGAISYDGDASSQVIFRLENGKVLRIGTTDEDVRDPDDQDEYWCDQYEGLFKEFK